jgi:Ca2+-binding RTX toxin-like protein
MQECWRFRLEASLHDCEQDHAIPHLVTGWDKVGFPRRAAWERRGQGIPKANGSAEGRKTDSEAFLRRLPNVASSLRNKLDGRALHHQRRARRPVGGVLRGAGEGDELAGENGEDEVYGLGGDDTVEGGACDDKLYGGPGRDDMDGDGGTSDVDIDPSSGKDTLYGGPGVDDLSGSLGKDILYGGDANDTLSPDKDGQRDELYCRKGKDVVYVGYSADKIDYVDDCCEKKEFRGLPTDSY